MGGLVSGAVFFLAVLRYGWLADDAFITIRSVENLLAGNGWGVNPGVRVQAFTSPLGALLTIPFSWALADPYAALMLPGLLCTVALIFVLRRAWSTTSWLGALALLACAASPTFLSFSTSGLENPLSHVLVAAFCGERLRAGTRPTRAGFWLGAALVLTRLDLGLIVLPALCVCLVREPRAALRALVGPALVVFGWLAFATFYFGFPLPNTAYAKLNVELGALARLGRGVEYVLDAAARDPLLFLVTCGGALSLGARGLSAAARTLGAGVLSYLGYVMAIGGDFMAGRFLTTTYVVAVVLVLELLRTRDDARGHGTAALGTVLGLLALAQLEPRSPDSPTECRVPVTGIVDERRCYVEHTGLMQNVTSDKWKQHGYLADFRKAAAKTQEDVLVFDLIGLAGYGAPRKLHVVERFALSEPLLARIRVRVSGPWRAGHFRRELPEGYLDSLRSSENHLTDPCLRDLYGILNVATRGPLWSRERLRAIWRLNTSRASCSVPKARPPKRPESPALTHASATG